MTVMQEVENIVYQLWQADEIEYTTFEKLQQAVTYKGIEKEKQQIIDAYNQGYRDGENAEESTKALVDVSQWADAEQYYNEKYKK